MWISCARGMSDIREQDSYLFAHAASPADPGPLPHRSSRARRLRRGRRDLPDPAGGGVRAARSRGSSRRWRTGRRRIGWPLVPRGAGSAMGGGNVGDGVIVDLTALPRRVEVDGPARRARASASVTLADLNAAADARRASAPARSLERALGHARRHALHQRRRRAHRCRYGSVRRWVEAVELVTADGEIAELRRGLPAPAADPAPSSGSRRTPRPRSGPRPTWSRARFPRTRKNASGYALDAWLASGDLLDLLIGAEGTLGFVTAAEWRLDPLPPRARACASRSGRSTCWATPCARAARARALRGRAARPHLPRAVGRGRARGRCCWSRSSGDDQRAAREAVERAAAAVRPVAATVDTGLTAGRRRAALGAAPRREPDPRRAARERRSLQVIEDGCVPDRPDGRVHPGGARGRGRPRPRRWSSSATRATAMST